MARTRALALLLALPLLALPGGTASAGFGEDEQKFENRAYPLELRHRVQQAVLTGANWLLAHQGDDGHWAWPGDAAYPLGPTALATLALLKSGIPAGHPRIERAFEYMRRQPLQRTYEVAILLMALDAKYDPGPDPFAAEELDRYGQRLVADPCATAIGKEDLAWMKQGMDFLVQHQEGGTWRYPRGGFDLSNTQYALLGLKAADRCGLKVPLEVWRSALAFLVDYQQRTGPDLTVRCNEVRGPYRIEWTEKARARGFTYVESARIPATGSMTTAGAAGLMICQSMLWKSQRFTTADRSRARVAIRDALAWLQANYDVRLNPGAGRANHYYYLYGLERMGILGHLRFVGDHDWYADGAELLMAEQLDGGAWRDGDVVETSFALLFLKRSGFRVENPVITPSNPEPAMGDGSPPGVPAPPSPLR